GVYSVTETVTATGVPQPAPGAPATDAMPTYTAIVTVSDAAGDSQTFSSLLAEEAPAPGSQVTPDPSQTYSPPPSGPTNGPGPGSGPGSDGGYGGHGCAINPVACPRPIRGPIPL
ncbi:MAG: hypothetical protein ACREM6_02355, partial [Vulcanimicrobiaceae bacterium]